MIYNNRYPFRKIKQSVVRRYTEPIKNDDIILDISDNKKDIISLRESEPLIRDNIEMNARKSILAIDSNNDIKTQQSRTIKLEARKSLKVMVMDFSNKNKK